MTLTHEENELLTRIGPGTPAGEVLRRYWHPIAVAQELTDENPTMFVRVVGEEGVRKVDVYPRLDCNWFQAMENSVDPAHLQILHQNSGGRSATNTTRGSTDDVASFDFYEVPYGIIKKRTYKNGIVDEHPL